MENLSVLHFEWQCNACRVQLVKYIFFLLTQNHLTHLKRCSAFDLVSKPFSNTSLPCVHVQLRWSLRMVSMAANPYPHGVLKARKFSGRPFLMSRSRFPDMDACSQRINTNQFRTHHAANRTTIRALFTVIMSRGGSI